MKRIRYIFIFAVTAIFFLAALTGCQFEETDSKKIKDLDYTVCDESKLPDELMQLINEKKKDPFKLTYRTNDYLYIVVGYGAQDRTDLNVVMTELYLTENADSPYRPLCESMLEDLNERLDHKAFENARLYYNMEDYLASSVALRNVLKDNAENIYREDILYYTAMSTYKYAFLSIQSKQKERYLVFVDDYLNFVGEYPESSYRRELDNLYRRAQRVLGRNTAVPGVTVEEEAVEKEED